MNEFLEALRAGQHQRCAALLKAMRTDQIQGLENEVLRARRAGNIAEAEWREFNRLRVDEMLGRFERGET